MMSVICGAGCDDRCECDAGCDDGCECDVGCDDECDMWCRL